MSESENFIARWSRRKREAAQDADATKAAVTPAPTVESEHPDEGRRKESDAAPAHGGALQPAEAAFDPATLPPIETITAESDIRVFLAPGVPPELTRAALRRAWATDPKIRDFVGLSENSWDFNAPGAIAGFGPLEMTDELRAHVAQMVGRGLGGESPDRPFSPQLRGQPSPPDARCQSGGAAAEMPADPAAEVPAKDVQSAAAPHQEGDGQHSEPDGPLPQRNKATTAPQRDPENCDNDQLIAKRLHGRALPK
jgi:Protein of unknown function (DUF3306)